MSKVISFSISDRYLDKLRTLYPHLTDNLAVKQFVTDGLESSLGNSLDANLDDSLDGKLKSLIESELDGILEGRLDAVVGKSLTSLSDRLSRLEERLDDSLDGRLDDSLDDRILTLVDSRLNESIARLASCLSQRLLALEKGLDDMEQLLRLQRESSLTSPLPTIEKTSPLPTIEETVEAAIEPVAIVETAINTVEAVTEIDESVDESGNSPLPPSPLPTGEPVRPAIETVVTVEAVYSVEAVTDTVETAIDTVESVESDSTVELVTGSIASDKGMTSAAAYRFLVSKNLQISPRTLDNWINSKIPESAQGRKAKRYIILKDKKYYSIE